MSLTRSLFPSSSFLWLNVVVSTPRPYLRVPFFPSVEPQGPPSGRRKAIWIVRYGTLGGAKEPIALHPPSPLRPGVLLIWFAHGFSHNCKAGVKQAWLHIALTSHGFGSTPAMPSASPIFWAQERKLPAAPTTVLVFHHHCWPGHIPWIHWIVTTVFYLETACFCPLPAHPFWRLWPSISLPVGVFQTSHIPVGSSSSLYFFFLYFSLLSCF